MKIVIKIGTQAILSEKGELQESLFDSIVTQLIEIQNKGIQVILVSSGAVGSGRRMTRDILGREYGYSTGEKQVLASIGQPELMRCYSERLRKWGVLAAQLLLTKQDFKTRQHYLNITRILHEVLAHPNILPIVNENDSVAVEELMFTDNDELAGLIAAQINADKLIILTSVKGVYDGSPDEPGSQVIPIINPGDKWRKVSSMKSSHGRGGMVSKLATAHKMSDLGIATHICHVNENEGLLKILAGEQIGTTILPFKKKSNVKRWMAFNTDKKPAQIFINSCLFQLMQDKTKVLSVLPVGILKYSGEFAKGDLIDILAPDGSTIGVGIAKYGSDKLKDYIGKNASPVFIHYDHLYIR